MHQALASITYGSVCVLCVLSPTEIAEMHFTCHRKEQYSIPTNMKWWEVSTSWCFLLLSLQVDMLFLHANEPWKQLHSNSYKRSCQCEKGQVIQLVIRHKTEDIYFRSTMYNSVHIPCITAKYTIYRVLCITDIFVKYVIAIWHWSYCLGSRYHTRYTFAWAHFHS